MACRNSVDQPSNRFGLKMCCIETRLILISFAILLTCTNGAFAQAPQPSLDELIAVVKGEDSIKSAAAITAIGKRKPTSDLAIQTLVDALADDRRAVGASNYVFHSFPVATVGSTAADALAEIGKPAVPRLREFITKHDNMAVRRLAIRSLAKMQGDAAEALPTLERLLGDPQVEIRFEAVAALVAVQRDPRSLSSVLGTVLSDKSPDVRAAAIRALGDLGESGARHVPHLLKLLDDPASRWQFYTPDMAMPYPVRHDAARALAGIGKDGRVALAKLREMMNGDANSLVRIAAAFAVAKLDDAPQDAMEYLIAAVQDDEKGYGGLEAAAESLGKLGPQAKAALPALGDALKHPETMVRIHAVGAIVAISPETAESRVLPMLKDEDALVRASAIENLGSLRQASPQLLRSYIAALDDSDDIFGEDVRHAAAVALGNLGEQATAAVPRLTSMAQEEESEWLKKAARESLRQITPGPTKTNKTKQ